MREINLNTKKFIVIIIAVAILSAIIGYFLPHEKISNFIQPYRVVKVVDGDTLIAKIGKKTELVRFLGINTPEVENPYRHQECFGPQASVETKKLLTGKRVYLLADPEAPNRGKYHRLLRYVFLPNGEFVNAELVKKGYAFSYIYQPIQFEDYFNYLQANARKNRLGLWSDKCNYYSKFKKQQK